MDTKQKYVRLEGYDEIIIFSAFLNHSDFKFLNPISAGFCYVNNDSVDCFGESIGLGIEGLEDDTFYATKQLFGWDAANKLKK